MLRNNEGKSKNYISDIFYLVDYYPFFFEIFNNKTNQARINNKPPMGVTNPIALKFIEIKLFVANKYKEPEKRIIPITTK